MGSTLHLKNQIAVDTHRDVIVALSNMHICLCVNFLRDSRYISLHHGYGCLVGWLQPHGDHLNFSFTSLLPLIAFHSYDTRCKFARCVRTIALSAITHNRLGIWTWKATATEGQGRVLRHFRLIIKTKEVTHPQLWASRISKKSTS